MSKISLIIPDIHLKWKFADRIIKETGADEVLFLGDMFDDFNDDPDQVRSAAEWFVKSVNTPTHIHLWGNHDVHYGHVHDSWRCSGYADWKYFAIQDIVSRETWNKLKWYHVLDNTFLLSHSGIHRQFVPAKVIELMDDRPAMFKELSEFLDDSIAKGLRSINRSNTSWIFRSGHSRGGLARYGGIIWCDFTREFYPERGLNQIVGHTPSALGQPLWCILEENDTKAHFSISEKYSPKGFNNTKESYTLGLDVWGTMHYAIWSNGKMEIRSYADL